MIIAKITNNLSLHIYTHIYTRDNYFLNIPKKKKQLSMSCIKIYYLSIFNLKLRILKRKKRNKPSSILLY